VNIKLSTITHNDVRIRTPLDSPRQRQARRHGQHLPLASLTTTRQHQAPVSARRCRRLGVRQPQARLRRSGFGADLARPALTAKGMRPWENTACRAFTVSPPSTNGLTMPLV